MSSGLLRTVLDAWPVVLIFCTIAGAIYKVGDYFGKFFATKEIVRKEAEHETQLNAVRKMGDAQREEALRWRTKFNEVAPQAGDKSAADKLNRIRQLIDKQGSVWYRAPLARPAIKPISLGGRPVLTIGNLKGGVGKTTIATHLAAEIGKTKKVLFVDLDFQGSGSTFLLRDADREDIVQNADRSRASRIIGKVADPAELQNLAIPLGTRTPGVSVVPAYYPLGDAEERLMLRWLLEEEPDDVRYYLRSLLHSDHLDYEIVIIDAPPRLSTAMAQAIAASTHILIPSQYERKSSEAAYYFAQVVRSMAENGVNSEVKVLGIVPSMVPPKREIDTKEVTYLKTNVAPLINSNDPLWEDAAIPYRSAFRGPNLVRRGTDSGSRDCEVAVAALAKKVVGRIWNASP